MLDPISTHNGANDAAKYNIEVYVIHLSGNPSPMHMHFSFATQVPSYIVK